MVVMMTGGSGRLDPTFMRGTSFGWGFKFDSSVLNTKTSEIGTDLRLNTVAWLVSNNVQGGKIFVANETPDMNMVNVFDIRNS